jgi:formylglycine-generating enzyme required for sulfatase activity
VPQASTPRLSPGTRTALIIGGLFLVFIVWTTYWVGKKAVEIKHQRMETTRVSSPLTGDMVWIPGGSFTMGGAGDQAAPDEAPLHDVKLNGFWIDRTEVTNEQFASFVKEKHYVTTAERPVTAKTIPGLLPRYEGKTMSLCFRKPANGEELSGSNWWWDLVVGATRTARIPTSPARKNIPSSTSATRTRRRIANGRASVCRPSPNGNARRAAASPRSRTSGVPR